MKKFMNWKIVVLAMLSSTLFILFFAVSISPIYPYDFGRDGGFFMQTGREMTRGSIPYVDFFDQKGPYMFFIQWIGQLIYNGKFGIFMIACFSLAISLYFAYQSVFIVLKDHKYALFIWVPFLSFYSLTIEKGNYTGDYCLPMSFVSLYIGLTYLVNRSKCTQHPPRYAFVYGLFAGIIALIRITNATLILSIVLTVLVVLLVDKLYKNILVSIVFFLLGLCIAFSIPILYGLLTGSLGEMFYQTFVFGYIYAVTGSSAVANVKLYIILVFLLVLTALSVSKKNGYVLNTLIIAANSSLMISYMIGFLYIHYHTNMIPNLVLMFCLIVKRFHRIPRRFIIIATSFIMILMFYRIYDTFEQGFVNRNKEAYDQMIDLKEHIPEDQQNSVYFYVKLQTSINYVLDIPYVNRYIAWQDKYSSMDPKITDEIVQMFDNNPPQYVVTAEVIGEEILNPVVFLRVRTDYDMVYQNEHYNLYLLKPQ
ncbi:MAG: hypothetical protein LBM60_03360 [Clostridium sp.]|jgi:hypothetical protein|nr:hypothetical protein [Clostridium sp.]